MIYQQVQLRQRVREMTSPRNAAKFSRRVVFPVAMRFSRVIIGFLGVFGNTANPYRKGYGYHTGLDYVGNDAKRGLGDPVYSIADGVVTHSSPTASRFGYGHMVVVEHPQFQGGVSGDGRGIASRYAHLQSRTVKAGDTVTAGQVIGYMGESGTDNVHLHFDLIKKRLLSARYFPRPGGWSRAKVLEFFRDPNEFFRSAGAVDVTPSPGDG
jgi:murein DD-endopeptidase MepM/ murein hydrolase activator NlpD